MNYFVYHKENIYVKKMIDALYRKDVNTAIRQRPNSHFGNRSTRPVKFMLFKKASVEELLEKR